MRSRIFWVIFFCAACFFSKAQTKWDDDLVVDYKMTDKDELLVNHIEVKKDTVFYEWMEKGKRSFKKMGNDSDLQSKLLKAMRDNKVLKLKTGKLTKGSANMVLTYYKGYKTKIIIFPQPVKQGSREENFIKEFMEPILKKLFAQELQSFPK